MDPDRDNPQTGAQPPTPSEDGGGDWQKAAPDGQSQEDVAVPAVAENGFENAVKFIVGGFVLVGAVVSAVGAYTAFFGNSPGVGSANQVLAGQPSQTAPVTAMTELNAVTLKAPQLDGFTSAPETSPAMTAYTSADGLCSLSFGVIPSKGNSASLDSMLAQLRSQGATVERPKSGTPLVLRDEADPAKSYSMPTYTYNWTTSNRAGVIIYNVAILKNGDTAMVIRQCAQESSGQTSVPELSIQHLEEAAKKLTVEI